MTKRSCLSHMQIYRQRYANRYKNRSDKRVNMSQGENYYAIVKKSVGQIKTNNFFKY